MEDSEEESSPKASNESLAGEPLADEALADAALSTDALGTDALSGAALSTDALGNQAPGNEEPGVLDRLRQLESRVAELEANQSADSVADPSGAVLSPSFAGRSLGAPPPPPPTWHGTPPPPTGAPLFAPPGPHRSEKPSGRTSRPLSEVGSEVLLKWSGLGLLFLAAVFLVGTAISRGWIGPRMQLSGAALGGLALIGMGLRLRKVPGWTEPLVQVGFAVLYVCSGAAWDWLDLGSATRSTAIAVGLTIHAIVLARHLRAWGIALVSLIGVLTVSIWVDYFDAVGIGLSFAFLFGIVILFTVLYLEQGWRLLWLIMVLATALLVLVEANSTVLGDVETPETMVRAVLLSLLALVYWFAPVALAFITKRGNSGSPISAGADAPAGADNEPLSGGHSSGGHSSDAHSSGVSSFDVETLFTYEFRIALFVPVWLWTTVLDFDTATDTKLVLVGAAIAVFAAVSAVSTRQIVGRTFFLTQCLAASIMISIVLVPLFDGPVLLAAFALQTAVLVGLIRHVDDLWFALQGVLSATIVLIVSGSWMLWAIGDDLEIGKDTVNVVIIGLAAVLSGLEHWWHRRKPVDAGPVRRLSTDIGELGLLACYAAGLLWVVGVFVHFSNGQAIVTAIWTGFAVVVIGAALANRSQRVLQLGLLTLALVVAKLLTIDLAEVDAFVRVALFFVIGLGLLALSYQLPRLMASPTAQKSDQSDSTDP